MIDPCRASIDEKLARYPRLCATRVHTCSSRVVAHEDELGNGDGTYEFRSAFHFDQLNIGPAHLKQVASVYREALVPVSYLCTSTGFRLTGDTPCASRRAPAICRL